MTTVQFDPYYGFRATALTKDYEDEIPPKELPAWMLLSAESNRMRPLC